MGAHLQEAQINTPSQKPNQEQFVTKEEERVLSLVKKILTARRTPARATNERTKRRTAKGDLVHTDPKYQNQMTKENRDHH